MSKRRLIENLWNHLGTHERRAKVYRDVEWQEYRVRFFIGGIYQTDADYHTDDKQDALDTATSFINKKD